MKGWFKLPLPPSFPTLEKSSAEVDVPSPFSDQDWMQSNRKRCFLYLKSPQLRDVNVTLFGTSPYTSAFQPLLTTAPAKC